MVSFDMSFHRVLNEEPEKEEERVIIEEVEEEGCDCGAEEYSLNRRTRSWARVLLHFLTEPN